MSVTMEFVKVTMRRLICHSCTAILVTRNEDEAGKFMAEHVMCGDLQ